MTKAEEAKVKQMFREMFDVVMRAKDPRDSYGRPILDPVTGKPIDYTILYDGEVGKGWTVEDVRKAYENILNADLSGEGPAMTYKDKKKALKEQQKLYKQAYDGYLNSESKAERAIKNIGVPTLSTAAKTAGNAYGLWQSGLAGALAAAASKANHSALGTTATERLGEAGAVLAAKGGIGALVGNAAGGLIDTVAEKYKQDEEMAKRQAYADVNDNLSGNYWNLAAKVAPRG